MPGYRRLSLSLTETTGAATSRRSGWNRTSLAHGIYDSAVNQCVMAEKSVISCLRQDCGQGRHVDVDMAWREASPARFSPGRRRGLHGPLAALCSDPQHITRLLHSTWLLVVLQRGQLSSVHPRTRKSSLIHVKRLFCFHGGCSGPPCNTHDRHV
jgi:hypothetical protein